MNENKLSDGAKSLLCRVTALLSLITFGAVPATAQNKPFDDPTKLGNQETSEAFGFKSGSIVAAPVPFESPSLGTGLALGGAYLFQNDRLSDASSIGLGAFKTSNDSRGYALGLNMSWNEDRWTAQFLAADADLNYDLFVLGLKVPVSQSLRGTRFQVGYSPFANYSFGGSLDYGEYTLSPQRGGALPVDLLPDAELKIARLSGFVEHDTRDDEFYPTRGTILTGTLTQATYIDLDRSAYTKAVASASLYQQVFTSGVVAAHAVACSSSDNAPFFDSCSLGVTDNFRGYVSTEFLDQGLFSLQAEYRGQLVGRLGYTVFAGAGSVADSFGRAIGGDYRAAGGVGLRIRLSKAFPLDYAIDLARNERGEDFLYISVGQRF